MQTLAPTVLLISHDTAVCSAVRLALKRTEPSCRITAVPTFAAARRTVADLSPDVILLEESALQAGNGEPGVRPAPLADIVATLAGFAPVVILGITKPPASLAALIAAGAADFVTDGNLHLPEAAAYVEKRLRSARRLANEFSESAGGISKIAIHLAENFGEVLRHELNNPLTGILGNAELLLAETRRQNGLPLSQPGLKRLETIAALAVRMRETVRRLSQACESRADHARSL
jgi:signal transduction histidine kinase